MNSTAAQRDSILGGVVLDASRDIWVTTPYGGPRRYEEENGTIWWLNPTLRPIPKHCIWRFDGTDGAGPLGSLILDSAHNLYGTTSGGGLYNHGVVFEIPALH